MIRGNYIKINLGLTEILQQVKIFFFKLIFKLYKVFAIFKLEYNFKSEELYFLTYLVMAAGAVQHKVVEKKVSRYRSTQREMVNKRKQSKKTPQFLTNYMCRFEQVFLLKKEVACLWEIMFLCGQEKIMEKDKKQQETRTGLNEIYLHVFSRLSLQTCFSEILISLLIHWCPFVLFILFFQPQIDLNLYK